MIDFIYENLLIISILLGIYLIFAFLLAKRSENKVRTIKPTDSSLPRKSKKRKKKSGNGFKDLRDTIMSTDIKHPLLNDSIELLDILNESQKSPLLVTVLGEFSSGKSTFINALLKEKLLAMKIRPTTATITKLQFGKKRLMTIHKMDGSVESRDIGELKKFTVETHIKDDKSLDDIFYVQLEIDNKFLTNIDLADTPGFNSTIERHTEITKDFIRHSDVVVWLFSAEQMLKKSEVETLEKYCKNFKPIVIINQIDKLGLNNKDEILIELDSPIKSIEGIVEKIFPVSSKLALNSVKGEFKKSGMQDVLDYFKTKVIPNAKNTKGKMAIVKLAEIAENLQTIRLEIVSKVEKVEKEIAKYKRKKTNWESKQVLWKKTVINWNKDWKSDKIPYDWMIQNLSRYFGIIPPSSLIKDKSSDLLSSFNKLIDENNKINNQYKQLTYLEDELNSLFIKYDSDWNIYNNKALGLKSFMDSVLGDVSEEKTKLNRLASKCNNKNDTYNNSVEKYNKYLNSVNQQWNKLNGRMEHFLNYDVLEEMNAQHDLIKNLSIELEDEEQKVKRLENYYRVRSNQLNLLGNDIVFDFERLYSSLESNIGNGEFNDFESMLKEFNSYSVQHSEINWKNLYSRDQLNTVVGQHKEKVIAHYIDAEQKDYNNRVAEKV